MAEQICKRLLFRYGDLSVIGTQSNSTLDLSVFSFGLCLPEGVAFGRATLGASCLLQHVLVACTLLELHQAFQRRKLQTWTCRVARVLSVGWFRFIQNLDISLIVFLRVLLWLGPSEGGIVLDSSPRKHCMLARPWQGLRQLYSLFWSGCTSHRTHPVPTLARMPCSG